MIDSKNLLEERFTHPQLVKTDVQKMEFVEVLYWQRLYERYAGVRLGEKDNVYFLYLEGTGVFLMPDLDILAFNRVVGLGLLQPTREDLVKKLIDIYQIAGIKRFFVTVNPFATGGTKELLEKNGFTYYNDWVKLFRHLETPIPQPQTDFRIVEIGADNRKKYADIIMKSFGFPEIAAKRFAKTLGSKGYLHFFAMDGEMPVATASMFIHGKIACMAGAGTLPDFRNRGAQTALLAKRLQLARQKGCNYAIVETARETEAKPVTSFRNMKKSGFEIAYVRPNFIKYL